jgi:hypothetical protein
MSAVAALAPGQPVIVNLAGEEDERGRNCVVREVAGDVIALDYPRSSAARFEIGRAVEVAAADGEVVLSATVVAGPVAAEGSDGGRRTGGTISLALGAPIVGREQRSWTRLRLAVPVCVSAGDGSGFHNFIGVTRDVSVGGLAVHGFAPTPVGPVIAVLHIDGSNRLALLGRVLDVNRPTDGSRGWITRVQFGGQGAGLREAVGRFVARAILEPGALAPPTRSGIDDMQHFRAVTRRGRPHAYSWREIRPRDEGD